MSGRDSLNRNTPAAVAKLKEGLQEAIVFLQTLGSFKIPAVIERRRKELLDKLVLLQGGTIKEKSPKFAEPDPEPEPAPVVDSKKPSSEKPKETEAVAKDTTAESSETSSAASSTFNSPYHGSKPLKRRDSTNVLSKIKDYESIHHSARKEEESETPKNRFVSLKRVNKPADFPANAEEEEEEEEEEEQDKEKSKEEDGKSQPNGSAVVDKDEVTITLDVDGSRARASSIVSGEESNDEEGGEEGKKKKKKTKKSGFGLGSKVKGFMKRDKSPLPERKRPPSADSSSPPEAEKEEQEQGKQQEEPAEEVEVAEEVPDEEEGVRISGNLGRLKKKMGLGKSAKQVHVEVLETTMMLGKEELDLTKCCADLTDIGFDLTHPNHKSAFMFKVEGDEEKRQKWVDALKEAIEKATPPEEEKPEVEETAQATNDSVPSITVEDMGSSLVSKKGKRESKALTPKPEKKLPDQGVTMKGNFLRKKPGISRSWEKTYCVLTFQAFYFSGEADTKDYSNMLPIYPNMDAKLESKKGKGDSPGLCLKLGKKQELFSFESQADCQSWKSAIENALGLGGVEELLSEDEEGGGANDGPEELYEELGLDDLPPVPASPRPSRPNIPAPAIPIGGGQDDFAIEEDIYEETDDILPAIQQSYHQSPQHVPSLPNRNPSKPQVNSTPGPSLPPRNAPAAAPGPSLPPRSVGGKPKSPLAAPPMDYEETTALPKIGAKPGAKAPAPIPTVDEDQELYDDVVVDAPVGGGGADDEEMYDDVVVGGGGENPDEELYDDVMTTSGLPTNGGVGGASTATNNKPAEPIMDEFYEDMAPGAVTDPYVALEKNKEEPLDDGDELYVDVDEPAKAPVQKLQNTLTSQTRSASPKIFGGSKNKKKASISSPSGTLSRGLVNGNVSYKAPKKSKFDEKWGCVEGTSLLVFKSSGDKKHQDKIPLGDCRLDIGSTEAGAGKFAFSLSKGDKYYHFSLRTQPDADKWVDVLKGIVKYAPVEAEGNGADGELEVLQAREDHIADSGDELTFKKGTIIKLIERKSKDIWYGQIGNELQVFDGKKGNFPAHKVEIAEDLYM